MLTNADGRQCFSYSNKAKSEVETNIKNTDVGPTQQDKIYFFGIFLVHSLFQITQGYVTIIQHIISYYFTLHLITLHYLTLH